MSFYKVINFEIQRGNKKTRLKKEACPTNLNDKVIFAFSKILFNIIIEIKLHILMVGV